MIELVESLGAWNWFILGIALLALEIAAPGTFMLWLGIAALVVGVVSYFVDWTWQAQFALFAVIAVASIPLWRRVARRVETPTDRPFLNRRAEGLVGKTFTIDKPIVNAVGTIRIDDTVWRVIGPDCPAGSRVRVTVTDGAQLEVALEHPAA
ncbi:MAG: NfeD family protein [Proteobacteria bacterium]|nr:NfeD family protein [Pseudomonadota bacterium]